MHEAVIRGDVDMTSNEAALALLSDVMSDILGVPKAKVNIYVSEHSDELLRQIHSREVRSSGDEYAHFIAIAGDAMVEAGYANRGIGKMKWLDVLHALDHERASTARR